MKHKRKLLVNLGAEGGGGNQPTLFAPIITVSGNNVTWERDSRNGGFNDVLDATIDNQSVSKPLTITAELDNKLLKVKSIAENFKDGVATRVLEYIGVRPVTKKCVLRIGSLRNYDSDTGNGIMQLAVTQLTEICDLVLNKGKFVVNGVDYLMEAEAGHSSPRRCALQVPINFQVGTQELDIYVEIFEDIQLPRNAGVGFSITRRNVNPLNEPTYGTSGTDTRSFRGSTYGFLDDTPAGTSNVYSCSIPTDENNVLKKGIYTAYFDMQEA